MTEEEQQKPNCYECQYRGGVAGSAHSSCKHPSFAKVQDDPLLNIMAIFASVGRVPAINIESSECKVTANPHGIRKGWFNHPYNFDPVWLETCTGFKPNDEQ